MFFNKIQETRYKEQETLLIKPIAPVVIGYHKIGYWPFGSISWADLERLESYASGCLVHFGVSAPEVQRLEQ